MKDNARKEQNALKLSMYGIVFFIILAFVYSFITGSDSILFDGIYSLISFAIAIVTIWVARMVRRPDDDIFHFGYSKLEPLLNVIKSLFIVISCVYAFVGAARSLFSGGNEIELGNAVIYSIVAALGGLVVGLYLRAVAKRIGSGLLKVEATEWIVDSYLSFGILAGFGIAFIINRFGWTRFSPYVDPALLCIITILALPAPVKILLENFRELIDMAPPQAFQDKIEELMLQAVWGLALDDWEFRIMKAGRNTFILVHLMVSDDFRVDSISELDNIRDGIEKVILGFDPNVALEILFIKDKEWAEF